MRRPMRDGKLVPLYFGCSKISELKGLQGSLTTKHSKHRIKRSELQNLLSFFVIRRGLISQAHLNAYLLCVRQCKELKKTKEKSLSVHTILCTQSSMT